LAFITATADCFSVGETNLDLCDPYGRPYTPYGLIPGKILAFFGIGFDQTWILGIALMLTWVLTILVLGYLVMRAWGSGTGSKLSQ